MVEVRSESSALHTQGSTLNNKPTLILQITSKWVTEVQQSETYSNKQKVQN